MAAKNEKLTNSTVAKMIDERVTLDEVTEIDWRGEGYYELRSLYSHASGSWYRWVYTGDEGDTYFETPNG